MIPVTVLMRAASTAPATAAGAVTVRIDFQNVLSLILAIVFVVLLGLVSNRLIGIKVGRWRSMLTALVGTLVGVAGAAAVAKGPNDRGVIYALTALFGVLATMVLLIIPEAIARTGVAPRRRAKRVWLHPIRWVRAGTGPRRRGPSRCSGPLGGAGWPGPTTSPRPVWPPRSSAAGSGSPWRMPVGCS